MRSTFLPRLLVGSMAFAALGACGSDDDASPSAGAGQGGLNQGGRNQGGLNQGASGAQSEAGATAPSHAGQGGVSNEGEAGSGAGGDGGQGGEGGSTSAGFAGAATGEGGEAGDSSGAGAGGGGSGGIPDCTPLISEDVADHVSDMATTGWAVRNANAGMLMYDCAGALTPDACLSSHPLASETAFGTSWAEIPDGVDGADIRVLRELDYATSYSTRSSADGRFVAHGGGSLGTFTFIDLAQDSEIEGDALYDPNFFPDGSGFMAAGVHVCEQSVLTTGSPTTVTFTEPDCGDLTSVELLATVGARLDEGDYWMVSGQFAPDDGGHTATLEDPFLPFGASSAADFTRILNTGSGFEEDATAALDTPNEGDFVLSPSARLLAARVAGPSGHAGYALRRVTITGNDDPFNVAAPVIARYCENGATPAFSYDERWMVFHHYIGENDAEDLGFAGASDPAFSDYLEDGAANVYLIDLVSGGRVRVTNMGPGQYALYPHFRSDGWIYFIVRDTGLDQEFVVAANAAILAP